MIVAGMLLPHKAHYAFRKGLVDVVTVLEVIEIVMMHLLVSRFSVVAAVALTAASGFTSPRRPQPIRCARLRDRIYSLAISRCTRFGSLAKTNSQANCLPPTQ